MKRSEALKLIDEEYANFIEDWLKADITNLENFIPLNERILKRLEASGMLPPVSKLRTLGITDNAWEPETDK